MVILVILFLFDSDDEFEFIMSLVTFSTWHFDTLTSGDDHSIPGADITKWTKSHFLLGTRSENSGNAPIPSSREDTGKLRLYGSHVQNR
jgi:hypothetical protein